MHAIRGDDGVLVVERGAILRVALGLVPFLLAMFVINVPDRTAFPFAASNGLTAIVLRRWRGLTFRSCCDAKKRGTESAGLRGDEMTYCLQTARGET